MKSTSGLSRRRRSGKSESWLRRCQEIRPKELSRIGNLTTVRRQTQGLFREWFSGSGIGPMTKSRQAQTLLTDLDSASLAHQATRCLRGGLDVERLSYAPSASWQPFGIARS